MKRKKHCLEKGENVSFLAERPNSHFVSQPVRPAILGGVLAGAVIESPVVLSVGCGTLDLLLPSRRESGEFRVSDVRLGVLLPHRLADITDRHTALVSDGRDPWRDARDDEEFLHARECCRFILIDVVISIHSLPLFPAVPLGSRGMEIGANTNLLSECEILVSVALIVSSSLA